MKTLSLILTLAFTVSNSSVYAQCNFDRLLQEGRAFYKGALYRQALKKFNAARICDPSKSAEVEAEIEIVFNAIEKQRDEEVSAREYAEMEEKRATEVQRMVERARDGTDSLLALQNEAFALLQQEEARASLEEKKTRTLILRGKKLLSDISDDEQNDVVTYLKDQGNTYFTYNHLTNARDYSKALVYFSLARFVQSDPFLDSVISCVTLGRYADSLFYAGSIEVAESMYQNLITKIQNINGNPEYELKQLERITLLQKQVEAHSAFNDYTGGENLILRGDWWAIPQEMLISPRLKKIVFTNNALLNRKLPFDLDRYPNIDTLVIESCSNFSGFDDWAPLRHLSALTIQHNDHLKELLIDAPLPRLSYFTVVDNPELIQIQGLDKLKSVKVFSLIGNPLLNTIKPSLSLPSVEYLTLKNNMQLPGIGQEDSDWPAIKSVIISDLKGLRFIHGARAYPFLENFVLERINNLDDLTGFQDLPMLTTMVINGTRLLHLNAFTNLKSLKHVSFENNPWLQSLPDAGITGKMKMVKIENNSSLGANEIKRFINNSNKSRLRNNPQIGETFIEIKTSRLFDNINLDYRNGKYIDRNFSGLYSFGVALKWEKHLITEKKDLLSFYPFLNYISYSGSTAFSETYWEATKRFYNTSGVYTENVRFIPGYEWVDLKMLDFSLNGKLAVPYKNIAQVYGFIGLGLTYRFPGEVGLDIRDFKYSEKVNGKTRISAQAGAGVAIFLGKFKVFAEVGLSAISANDEAEAFVVRNTFYSADAITFDTEPISNAYEIRYDQETIPDFKIRSLGIGYRVNFW